MTFRVLSVLVLLTLCFSNVDGQTVRFDTNVGSFDMVLNPTGNANLQGHVDNILAYVESGRYDQMVLNRAVDRNNNNPLDDFVLQMGGFTTNSLTLPTNFNSLSSVPTSAEVVVDQNGDNEVDFDTTGLSNVRGTVTMALSSAPTTAYRNDTGSPQVNSGTSSFFINLGSNVSLDPGATRTILRDPRDDPSLPPTATIATGGFVPFAQIRNMATIDLIMSLEQLDYQSTLLPSQGNPTVRDVPFIGNNQAVFVERVYVVEEMVAAAAAAVAPASTSEGDAGTALASETNSFVAASSQITAVPEPPALVFIIGAMVFLAVLSPRKTF